MSPAGAGSRSTRCIVRCLASCSGLQSPTTSVNLLSSMSIILPSPRPSARTSPAPSPSPSSPRPRARSARSLAAIARHRSLRAPDPRATSASCASNAGDGPATGSRPVPLHAPAPACCTIVRQMRRRSVSHLLGQARLERAASSPVPPSPFPAQAPPRCRSAATCRRAARRTLRGQSSDDLAPRRTRCAVDRVRAGSCGVVGLAAVNAEDGSRGTPPRLQRTIRVRRVAPRPLARQAGASSAKDGRSCSAWRRGHAPIDPLARTVSTGAGGHHVSETYRTEVKHLQRRDSCSTRSASRAGAVRGGEHAARHPAFIADATSHRAHGQGQDREVSRCSRDGRQRPPARANRVPCGIRGRGGPRRDGTSRPPPRPRSTSPRAAGCPLETPPRAIGTELRTPAKISRAGKFTEAGSPRRASATTRSSARSPRVASPRVPCGVKQTQHLAHDAGTATSPATGHLGHAGQIDRQRPPSHGALRDVPVARRRP